MSSAASDTETEKKEVTFGFNPNQFGGDEEVPEISGAQRFDAISSMRSRVPLTARNTGLGKNLGGQLTKSAFGGAAYQMLDPCERARQVRYQFSEQTLRQRKVTYLPPDPPATPLAMRESSSSCPGKATRLPKDAAAASLAMRESSASQASQVTRLPADAPAALLGMRDRRESSASQPRSTTALRDGDVPGMYRQLMLCECEWPTEQVKQEELRKIGDHRWNFHGALGFAEKGRDFCFFVRCLLDLQRNIQLEDEFSSWDPSLRQACILFVNGQCRMQHAADMYQLLTHFISNTLVFDEWDHYLKTAFESGRAQEESFLVPHLEQVWSRFCRFVDILEDIFKILNIRFVLISSLPQVRSLLHEHMRRRCFSRESVTRNVMFVQEKCSSNAVKAIKRALGFGT